MTTLDEAKAIIERMKKAPDCDCECCVATHHERLFPWADRLDAERVREYAEKQRHRFIWPLAELKALVEP
jgi:hypothetical protein